MKITKAELLKKIDDDIEKAEDIDGLLTILSSYKKKLLPEQLNKIYWKIDWLGKD